MSESKYDRFFEFINSDDFEFYEKFLVNLSDEELEEFLRKNPDFLKE